MLTFRPAAQETTQDVHS